MRKSHLCVVLCMWLEVSVCVEYEGKLSVFMQVSGRLGLNKQCQ